jgi:hypothetical protein
MLLYCFACVFNVALDLITTYMVAYRINVGLRMKTYDGGDEIRDPTTSTWDVQWGGRYLSI